MGLQLYDLAGAEPERRFSPYCWRIKLALMHKGLPFGTIPWRFIDKHAIAFSRQSRVPVLIDGDHVVFDSWTIANYLEDAYPDRPSLFRGEGGRSVTRFANAWADVIFVRRQRSLDRTGGLKKGEFLAHRNVHRSEDETANSIIKGTG
jgi:glutathione S-transferase